MELNAKRVLVVGLGKSGVAAAFFLKDKGARVTVSDAKTEDQLREHIPALLDRGIVVEAGRHGERTFRDQDLIVVSPGVPYDEPHLQAARALGVPVIGEVELAARFLQGPIVAITGSNGKTTTTSLIGEIFAKSGLKTQVGGNIGKPVIEMAAGSTPETWNVLEISSFQLETIETFHPKIAVVLNVTPDHLDRHRTFAGYVAAKARILENQAAADFAVLNMDDATCVSLAKTVKAQVRGFSRRGPVRTGAYIKDGKVLYCDASGEREVMPLSEIMLKGAHNQENVLAAVCAATLAGCKPAQIATAVREFRAVEHRLEFVANINGVEYYNDSKATNVDATIKALESFPGGIHLILGGKDKGSDYSVLNTLLKERVKRVYTIGAAAAKIEQQISPAAQAIHAETLETAVRKAAEAAISGDVVLLAPACASFDQFSSYEQRGRAFKELVNALAARKGREVQGGAA
ncbi:MAG: UDP-N-acetylmuramoyl-L-alanine--D-glutamate ligase [Candidatus Koribacter versatilis]|uniref:UDP-N-acetylmuramoylalanine--D-glutamate ligase n=1 Tax=Candidatus Korobacter versatilis TaxID=658062 RepID=A0A932A7W6_9BACT|nr:UDP-N-acetylmuramoyl-L-alanine--D-glutamate ligase [Candidatus Koribacter versatilis]